MYYVIILIVYPLLFIIRIFIRIFIQVCLHPQSSLSDFFYFLIILVDTFDDLMRSLSASLRAASSAMRMAMLKPSPTPCQEGVGGADI